jgi:YggT family protein
VIGNTLVQIISALFTLWNLILLARILLSWFNLDPSHPVVRFIHSATEPVLEPVRRLLPSTGMFDFSPMIVLIGSFVVEQLLLSLVVSLF